MDKASGTPEAFVVGVAMGRKIEELDRNFRPEILDTAEIIYHNCLESPFSVEGVYQSKTEEVFCRVSDELCNDTTLNEDLRELMYHTSGGRIRFQTNSSVVAVQVVLKEPKALPHMASTAVMGFDLYAKRSGFDGLPVFTKTFVPHLKADGVSYQGSISFTSGVDSMREFTLYFPLYCKVVSVSIGLSPNAVIKAPHPYRVEKPVVFYGSSITQGACSSRPGNSYPAILSRMLNCDIRNLGFSGNAHGEHQIAEYIAKLKMSAFVLDYDYNARSEKELSDTHYAFYQTIREKNPDLPIIMLSAPVAAPVRFRVGERRMEMSRVIIMESFIRGRKAGDENLYFIDGEAMFDGLDAKDSLVDTVHPTDLGFRSMAKRIYPVLNHALYHG